ncbi:NAD(P)-dependent oxidoreductase [Microbacterium oleivorans]|uniref:NAD-dependent epimerase/dehydratase family protein n=1 Tax=Microbacterium oleivorans TaxID=273677 RepID=A0A4R5YL86_9MICO|nr:NAD(P)H-binding protein [Microbacterium oleivorans]TDL44167.1 NAD-dependent epimerase/dehydratase family protein [Microbacterium oleivorans]
MANITIIGGHGKVGLLLAPLLVEAGHDVTSVIRNPDHSDDITATGATPLVADVAASATDEITELLADSDAVVWSAGAGGGSAERTYAVDRDAAIRSIDAAVAAEARRYVMVSYFGAGPDHGVDPSDDFFAYAESKAAADEHLRAAELDWTILAPSALTLDEPTGRIDANAEKGSSVSRADVAAVVAAVLADPSTIRRTISFNNGDEPIADAIRA